MNKPLHIDFETRSAVDLRSAGLYRYFEDPTTDILCMAYAFGDEEPHIWTAEGVRGLVPEVTSHIANGGEIIAWNVAFERQGFEQIMGPRYGFPVPKLEQYRCTMAESYAMALPGSLDQAAPAIGLDIKKDNAGYRLMMKMCKPRLPRKGEATDKILWHETEEDKQRLYEYCKQDVRVEQAIAKRVLRLTDKELKIFQLDMQINDRGVHIDKPLCEQAKRIVLRDTQRLDDEMRLVTKGAVASGSAVAQLCDYLQDAGVPTASVAKDVITDLLILDIPNDCRRALEIRKEVAKTSTAKIDSMLSRVQSDGRMRGNLQYHGAGTGRAAARGTQLQNLPRPEIIKGDDESFSNNYELAISTIMSGSNVLVDMLYGKPLTVVADCIRGMITAAPGNDLLASDFSNIEGRVVAWLAGQEDKLGAFRAFDEGTGPDLYLVAAGGIFGVETKDAKPYRQIGKVTELSMGYAGGAQAFAKMSKNYGMQIGDHYANVWGAINDKFKEEAIKAWPQRGVRTGMEQKAWLAAEVIKLAWREKNHKIQQCWRDMEAAAIHAVSNPGETAEAGRCRYKRAGSFLWCLLPSGRALCYPFARMKQKRMPWSEDDTDLRWCVVYKSTDQFTRQWTEKIGYSGIFIENATQAVARDIMMEAMLRVEQKGYNVTLTVHDEILAEVPKGFGSLEEFQSIMTELPSWATGLPVSASGWRGERYRKG